MEIAVREEEKRLPVTVFEVRGDIDIITSPDLVARARAGAAAGTRNLGFVFCRVHYISSAGVTALHQIFLLLRTEAAEESDAAMLEGLRAGTFVSPHLKLVHPGGRVEEALKNTGLDMYLTLYPTVEAALNAF
jgi:anti-anti-sigma regulatory factor